MIAEILGIDPSRGDDFAEWVRGVLELGLTDPEVREKYRKIIERSSSTRSSGGGPSPATISSRT